MFRKRSYEGGALSNKQHPINYLYFLFLLIIITAFSSSYFLREEIFLGAPLFFLTYALLQILLGVSCLVFLATLLKRSAPNWLFYTFIGACFTISLAYYADYTLLRLMDTSLSYIFKFFFGSGLFHLPTAFLALNLNPFMTGLILVSLILVPLIGVGFYALTHTWTLRKPWSPSLRQIGLFLTTMCVCLVLLDTYGYSRWSRSVYEKHKKALPLGTTFFSPSPKIYELQKPLAALREEKMVSERIEKIELQKERLPNLYLFIIETLRSDFMQPEIAPQLSHFARENITFSKTRANANYSNCSWFAILHSTFPHQWTYARDTYREGAAPLRILQKLGYKIRIYSSSDLSYFQMQKILFGEKNQLIDHFEQYTDLRELAPCDRDALAVLAAERDLEKYKEGTVYLFFFDSTHSEYSFPSTFPLKFTPITDQISYLTISKSNKDLELLKNRYRNSIAYVDSLVGSFFSFLQKKGLYEESIIALTADHGEEFFEKGSLFHGTHLNDYQTAVPIYCKLGNNDWKTRIDPKREHMAHVDLLPSILHYLTKSNDLASLFDGQSIFAEMKWPFHFCVLQNGPNPPIEFRLEWQKHQVNLRLAGPQKIELLESQNPLSPETIQQILQGLETLPK